MMDNVNRPPDESKTIEWTTAARYRIGMTALTFSGCLLLLLLVLDTPTIRTTTRHLDGEMEDTASILLPQMTIGAYYYPWYVADNNFHNGNYVRQLLSQQPQLGEYDQSNKKVIDQHLKWSQYANIGLWVTSWWGPNKQTDLVIKNVILKAIEGTTHKIALLYETSNRMAGSGNKNENATTSDRTHRIIDDISYICETYFSHPNYYHIQGRPVLVVYVTRVLDDVEGLLEESLLLARTAAAKKGFMIYLIGDQAFGKPPITENGIMTPEAKAFEYLDAVTNYDVYGTMGRGYAGKDAVDEYYGNQIIWRRLAMNEDCGFIPSVTPGFNDYGVRFEANHTPLSRRLSATKPEGSFFAASLKRAVRQTDSATGNLVLVNSFNEWHEDTQIEPCIGPSTDQPYNLTTGLMYEGYGNLYLDILKRMTPLAALDSPGSSKTDREANNKDKQTKRTRGSRRYYDVIDEGEEKDVNH